MARAETTLTTDQLRGFADAFGASKCDQFSNWRPPLRMKGEDPQEAYENYRDVATSALEALQDGRAIFDNIKVSEWACQAGIPSEMVAANMPLLQKAVAQGTARYCIEIAKGLRPTPSPRPRWRDLFWRAEINAADVWFDTLSDMFLAGADAFERGMASSDTDAGSTPRDPVHVSDHASVEEQPTRAAEGASSEVVRHKSARNSRTLGAVGRDAGAARERDRVDPDRDDGTAPEPACAPQPTSEAAPEYVAGALTTSTTTLHARDPDHEAVVAAAPSLAQKGPSSEALATTNPHDDEWDGRLSTVWPTIVEAKITIGEWKVSRRPELAGTLRIFTRLLGDISILTMTRDQASRLRERYFKLPTDHKNLWFDHEKGRDRTYDELMAHVAKIEADQGRKLPRVTNKTWNKQKGTLSAAIQWLKANREAAKAIDNAFEGLHVRVGKTVQAIRLERSMATTASLEALFKSEYWTGRRDDYHLFGKGGVIVRDSLYWVPLFEVCLGLRREEACQLRGRHFRRKFGYLGIDLFAEDKRCLFGMTQTDLQQAMPEVRGMATWRIPAAANV